MLGITWKDRKGIEIRKMTKVTEVIEHVKKLQWQWAGQIARKEDGRWTREILDWYPKGWYLKREWKIKGEDFIQQWA